MITAFALIALTSNSYAESEVKLQKDLLAFATNNLGKQVGSGQCAELISKALDAIDAKPFGTYEDFPATGDYVWGRKVATISKTEPATELKPGMILQFRNVKIVTKSGYATFTFSAPHHTLIVEEFNQNTGETKVIEQNNQGRTYVTRDNINLNGIKSGTIWAYTPQPK
ncbi:MAG: hypothetical protein ACKVQS_13460 [Fimbriimonadaceae bacterium]